jgi:hypothetical protein
VKPALSVLARAARHAGRRRPRRRITAAADEAKENRDLKFLEVGWQAREVARAAPTAYLGCFAPTRRRGLLLPSDLITFLAAAFLRATRA